MYFWKNILITVCLAGLSGCAEFPTVNYDVIRAKDAIDPAGHIDRLREQGELIAGTPFVAGNTVDLLRDGAAAYPAMLHSIATARKRIDMESYTFDDGEGKKFAAALLLARTHGVEVNVIYDSWGSSGTSPKLFDRMRAGGIRVLEYNPTDPESIIDFSINKRDHRKLLIVDGKTAFTGGVNVSNVYSRKLKRIFHISSEDDDVDIDKLPWRDTQVKIEGPVVAEFEHLFIQTWHAQNGDGINNPPPTPTAPRGDMSVQALDGNPDRGRFMIYRTLVVAIALAHQSVHLTTAYFVPPPDLIRELKAAAARGVDVTLVLPSESDSDLSLRAGHAFYEDLIEAGVHIYERQGVILHAKTAVVDGAWSMVGSSNLDRRSVIFNNECNAVILGPEFGRQMEALFLDDLAQSRHITRAEWGQRSFLESLDEWKARLVSDLL